MKILMMVLQFPPAPSGGVEMQCFRQARALVRRGHDVMIVTKWLEPRSARFEIMDGVRVYRRGCFFSVRPALRRRAGADAPAEPAGASGKSAASPVTLGTPSPRPSRQEWLRNAMFLAETAWAVKRGRFRADVVHVHESHWIAGFAQWLGETMGVPVFCKEASQPVFPGTEQRNIPWENRWQARIQRCRFIAMTECIAGELAAAGIPAARIVNIPNGVEIPAETADPGRHEEMLYVGNFTQGAEWKGFDVLFQALGRAVQAAPELRLRLLGAGDSRAWQEYAAAQGCGNSVVFAGVTANVWAAHRQAGCLVLPSRREGLSNALLEALASGLPAVVSDIPGNVAAVRDGSEGLVVPVDDVNALAAALLKLYRSPELRAQMGRAARERARTEFSLETVAERLELAYTRAIDEDATGSNIQRK